MEEKTDPNFEAEMREKLGNARRAGRPPKGAVPSRISGAVARLAADYLETNAPEGVSRRQINLWLSRHSEDLDSDPFELIEGLGARKSSIPQHSWDDPLSNSLRFSEVFPALRGVTQVLYAPYVDLLSQRTSIDEVHSLLILCRGGQNSALFRGFRGRYMRTRRSAREEIEDLDRAIIKSKRKKKWRAEFLDYLGIALGLLQESAMTLDGGGTERWRTYLLGDPLSFGSWPHCSRARQVEMDALVRALVQSAPIKRYSLPITAMGHLATRALSADALDSEETTIGSLVKFYLCVRDGRIPDPLQEAKALTAALTSLRIPTFRRKEVKELLRNLRAFRKQS